uniref:SFRICE_007562 n=1 Tax=Spodoptera frugiperda TaxID=7108 RepID=A0A2H1VJ17_SPOFR
MVARLVANTVARGKRTNESSDGKRSAPPMDTRNTRERSHRFEGHIGLEIPPTTAHSTVLLCEAQLWPANHLYDGVCYFGAAPHCFAFASRSFKQDVALNLKSLSDIELRAAGAAESTPLENAP